MADKVDYKRYLASREWAVLRRQVIDRADGGETCERCSASKRDHSRIVAAVHHLTYDRIGHEDLEDLQGVCGECHSWLSGVSDDDPIESRMRDEMEWRYRSGDTKWGDELKDELTAYVATSPRPESISDWYELYDRRKR